MRTIALLAMIGMGSTSAFAAETKYPPLPAPAASLGVVACDGYLYIYGGHIGKTHSYDTKAVIGSFHRLKLDGGTKWEELPGGPIAQGMNLATHDGKVYRVGGMSPRNAPGEPSDNHSLTDASVYDPVTGKWTALPSLPTGRSSHDVVVVGDKLYVLGGWQMNGKDNESTWPKEAFVLDLASKDSKWESIPQPFQRRALIATVVGSKVYIMGGLGDKGTSQRVDIFDVKTGKWSQGPDLPKAGGMGFSPAAATVGGRVVVNMIGGPVYRPTADGTAWEKVGEATQKRMVHRMIPMGDNKVLLVGGASQKGPVAEMELVELAKQGEKVASTESAK